MNKLSAILLSLLVSFQVQAVLVKAEFTHDRFIKIEQISQSHKYKIETCEYMEIMKCYPLFENDTFITQQALNELSSKNYLYSGLALASDIAIPALLIYFGSISALGVVVHLSRTGALITGHGAANAGYAAAFGTAPTTILSAGLVYNLDELDPFMHRDMSLAYNAATEMVNQDDLDDLDAYQLNKDTVVIIEGIDFKKLTSKIKSQIGPKIIKDKQEKGLKLKQTSPEIPWQYIH